MKNRLTKSETELIQLAKAGDQLAFRQLVELHQQQVRATVIGMLGPQPEANDVAQEVFIRFYKAMKSFRGEAKLSSYLSRIAINLSLNELKKRKKQQQRFASLTPNGKPLVIADQHQAAEQKDTQDMVQYALSILEPDFRSVVVLRMIDGYSTEETAKILQIPMGTVGSRLSRAQLKLKEILSTIVK